MRTTVSLSLASFFAVVTSVVLASDFALAIPPAAKRLQAPDLRQNVIYNGAPVAETGKTWHYVVRWQNNTSSCSGVFISHDTMLTAAHCFKSLTREDLYISLFRSSEVDQGISIDKTDYRLSVHPEHVFQEGYSSVGSDIAVLVFRKPDTLPYERNVGEIVSQAQTSSIQVGDLAIMVGAGRTGDGDGHAGGTLRHVNGKVFDFPHTNALTVEAGGARTESRAYGRYSYFGNVDRSAAGGICKGDSGGPALWRSKNALGQYYLMGILGEMATEVGGQPNDSCAYGGRYTILNAVITRWVYAQMDRLRKQLEPLREKDREERRLQREREQRELEDERRRQEEWRKAEEARKFPHVRIAEEAAKLQQIADQKTAEAKRAQELVAAKLEELRKAQAASVSADEQARIAKEAADAKLEEAKKALEAYNAANRAGAAASLNPPR